MCFDVFFVQIQRLCNVRYRKFEFGRYPAHVRQLQTYAFKPIIIHVSWYVSSRNFLRFESWIERTAL